MLTNEERRVVCYSGNDRPTVARTVTPDTPLEALNLNWRERDLPERERTKHVHRLHPYLGKFVPQLVEIFLRKYFQPGDTVLDPFVGSGTTLVQANELGVNAVGYDVSAFNVLLCRAKTTEYEPLTVRAELLDALQRTRDAESNPQAPQLPLLAGPPSHSPSSATSVDEYLTSWYHPQALRQLLLYRHCLKTGRYACTDLLKVVLSRSARSARLTTHFDLDFPKRPQTEPYWCYKHSHMCTPTDDAMKFLERYTIDTIHRVADFARLRTSARVTVWHEDSSTADFPPADGVITSPPYVGLIDYHGQHAYAYHLLGLQDKRHWEIGPAANGSGETAKADYQQAIAEVFRRVAHAMPSGGRVVVVAADKFGLYPAIASLAGLEEEAVVQRHVNRRTGRRSGEFYESVFVWRKG